MEFSEVMRQWRRICDKHTCYRYNDGDKALPSCPIFRLHGHNPCGNDPIDWTEEATKQFEQIVVAWAAEHPEPVYPTWGEWLLEQGVVRVGTVDVAGFTYQCVSDKIFEPIPTDTAEKLGIEPKK